MYYKITMNGNYMNCYKGYKKACEEAEILKRRFPMARIEVIEA